MRNKLYDKRHNLEYMSMKRAQATARQNRVVLVVSDVFLRRWTPALWPHVRFNLDYWTINIFRPFSEIRTLLKEIDPSAIITEELPRKTKAIIGMGYPTVVADTDVTYDSAVAIDVDDFQVGETAARYFFDAGHRKFACLRNPTPYGQQRFNGYRLLLEQSGYKCDTYLLQERKKKTYSEYWQEPDAALLGWLQSLPKPIALFAVHDPLGRMVCETARLAGIKIPEEISVVGANDDELVCRLSYPSLSSVAIPWNSIGEKIGQITYDLVQGKAVDKGPHLLLPGQVVERHSTSDLAVSDPMLRRALVYLRENMRHEITIGTLCRELSLPRRYIERSFRKQFRSSPYRTLQRFRLENACRLLRETREPIARVAEDSGFTDLPRFSQTFKAYTQKTPSAYRKQYSP